MIPLKTMRAKVHWMQARRIRCDPCGTPFVYLHQGDENLETIGVPLLSSDKGMNEGIAKQARKRFGKFAQKPRVGAALCPACRRYQPWMVHNSRFRSVSVWGISGFAVAMCAGGLLAVQVQEGESHLLPCGFDVLVVGAGVAIGWMRALPSGVQRKWEDPLAIPDEDFRGLLAHCRRIDGDPVVEWYLSLNAGPPEDTALVSLGCEDFTGEEFFPPKWSSGTVMGSL